MISKCAYPLVRSMLANVHNGTFLATHRKYVPLVANDINLGWVGTGKQFPTSEQDLVAAEITLGQQPDLVAGVAQAVDDSTLPQDLVLVANAYCESIGIC